MLPALGKATLLLGNMSSHTQATVLQVTEHQSHFTDWRTEALARPPFPAVQPQPTPSLLVDPHMVLLAAPGSLVVAVPTPYQLLTYKCPGKENIFILSLHHSQA